MPWCLLHILQATDLTLLDAVECAVVQAYSFDICTAASQLMIAIVIVKPSGAPERKVAC